MGEILLKDLVPVTVVLADGTRFLRARVFVTDQRIQVWTDGRPPRLEVEEALVDVEFAPRFHPSASAPHFLTTATGTIRVSRAIGACTCSLPGLMALRWPT